MTLEEITHLRDLDENGSLRKPKGYKKIKNSKALREVNNAVAYLLLNNEESFSLLGKMTVKGFKGIKSIRGAGKKDDPYFIKTNFGSGSFYHAHEFFADREYPKCIVKNEWFNNCYMSVTKGYIKDCQILSGIAYRGEGGKPFLHSVLKVHDKIIDYNYDMCMDEELYKTLFSFEVLSELDSKTIMKDYSIVKKFYSYLNSCGLTTMHAVFAWEDLVNMVNSKIKAKEEKVEIK